MGCIVLEDLHPKKTNNIRKRPAVGYSGRSNCNVLMQQWFLEFCWVVYKAIDYYIWLLGVCCVLFVNSKTCSRIPCFLFRSSPLLATSHGETHLQSWLGTDLTENALMIIHSFFLFLIQTRHTFSTSNHSQCCELCTWETPSRNCRKNKSHGLRKKAQGNRSARRIKSLISRIGTTWSLVHFVRGLLVVVRLQNSVGPSRLILPFQAIIRAGFTPGATKCPF